MSNSNSSQPFEWPAFIEKVFGKQFPLGSGFPFGLAGGTELPIPDTGKLQEAVRQIVERSVPQLNVSDSGPDSGFWPGYAFRPARVSTGANVFQTHRSVFVRLPFPKRANPSDIRIWATSERLTVKGIGRAPVNIRLPAAVRAAGGKARIKDGILEVRLPKTKRKGKPRELFVEW